MVRDKDTDMRRKVKRKDKGAKKFANLDMDEDDQEEQKQMKTSPKPIKTESPRALGKKGSSKAMEQFASAKTLGTRASTKKLLHKVPRGIQFDIIHTEIKEDYDRASLDVLTGSLAFNYDANQMAEPNNIGLNKKDRNGLAQDRRLFVDLKEVENNTVSNWSTVQLVGKDGDKVFVGSGSMYKRQG